MSDSSGIQRAPSAFKRCVHFIRWRAASLRHPLDSLSGVFSDFPAALRAAPRKRPIGYDSAKSTGWFRDKHKRLAAEDYAVVFWLRSAFESCNTVFEIGGHVGVAYYGFANVLNYPAGLEWTICEVPDVVRAGTELAKERSRTDLRFVTSPDQCEGADIILAAGSLQYIDSPSLADTIASFRRRPAHILINNVPAYDGPAFVTIQDIGTAYCAYRIFNRSELIESLERLDYQLIASWNKVRRVRIPGHPDKSFDHYSGYYLRSSRN